MPRKAKSTRKPVTVVGIVDAMGPGGSQNRGEKLWAFSLDLTAWRLDSPGAAIQSAPLALEMKVTQKQLDQLMDAIDAETIVRLNARLNPKGGRAKLVKYLGQVKSDKQLNAALKKQQTPVTFKDPQFGTFTFNRQVSWFEARSRWNGKRVKLVLHASEPAEVEKAMKSARLLWKAQKKWHETIGQYAAAKLLKLKNENWSDDDDPPLTAAQFRKKMTLQAIQLHPNGTFDFWHDDGDLFYGHSIQISGSIAKGPNRADIPG